MNVGVGTSKGIIYIYDTLNNVNILFIFFK